MEKLIHLDSAPDTLFRGNSYPKPFEFNQEVAHVFDDMVGRSVPMYADVAYLAGQWALRFFQKGSRIYDVGCSTGTVISFLAHSMDQPCDFIGIDLSEPMILKARAKLRDMPERHKVELICDDVMNHKFYDASVVVVNYTLQFLPVSMRHTLIHRIYEGLKPGGILFLSEKTKFENPEFQEVNTLFYEEFKLRQGYTRSEIARKKEALENVLIPFTEKEYIDSMSSAGFLKPEPIGKWYGFTSFVAQKPRRASQ